MCALLNFLLSGANMSLQCENVTIEFCNGVFNAKCLDTGSAVYGYIHPTTGNLIPTKYTGKSNLFCVLINQVSNFLNNQAPSVYGVEHIETITLN